MYIKVIAVKSSLWPLRALQGVDKAQQPAGLLPVLRELCCLALRELWLTGIAPLS